MQSYNYIYFNDLKKQTEVCRSSLSNSDESFALDKTEKTIYIRFKLRLKGQIVEYILENHRVMALSAVICDGVFFSVRSFPNHVSVADSQCASSSNRHSFPQYISQRKQQKEQSDFPKFFDLFSSFYLLLHLPIHRCPLSPRTLRQSLFLPICAVQLDCIFSFFFLIVCRARYNPD